MANNDSRVTIHMVASLDGFIARRDGSVDWLETEFYSGDLTSADLELFDTASAVRQVVDAMRSDGHDFNLHLNHAEGWRAIDAWINQHVAPK